MKTIHMISAVIAAAMMLFTACGNVVAQNDKKKDNMSKEVKELNADSFAQLVYNVGAEDLVYLGKKPAIIDFTASWCGPCQRIAPILEELAKEYKEEIVIYKVDVDKEKELAKRFRILSVPTLIICGDRDPYINYNVVYDVLTHLPAGSALEVMEGGAHLVMYEQPYYHDFWARVMGYLND